MCRKVRLSTLISKRKCLINSKCCTKDPFSFTSPFISLKNALFLLLSCYHSTLRNTTCMLYQSAHPQICLQPNTASPSLFKTNILSLLPRCCSEDPQKRPGCFTDIWQPAQQRFGVFCWFYLVGWFGVFGFLGLLLLFVVGFLCMFVWFFPEENLQKAGMCLKLVHVAGWIPHQSQGPPLGVGAPGTRDPRALLSTLLTCNKRSSGQQGRTAIPRELWCCSQ